MWGYLGFAIGAIGSGVHSLVAVAGYAAWYGFGEATLRRRGLLGSRWGVPASWITDRNNALRTAIWGCVLGPGLFTRNPYAGMWFLPLLLANAASPRQGLVLGALTGVAHGVSRMLTIFGSHKCELGSKAAGIMLKRAKYAQLDGRVLLFVAGMTIGLLVESGW